MKLAHGPNPYIFAVHNKLYEYNQYKIKVIFNLDVISIYRDYCFD